MCVKFKRISAIIHFLWCHIYNTKNALLCQFIIRFVISSHLRRQVGVGFTKNLPRLKVDIYFNAWFAGNCASQFCIIFSKKFTHAKLSICWFFHDRGQNLSLGLVIVFFWVRFYIFIWVNGFAFVVHRKPPQYYKRSTIVNYDARRHSDRKIASSQLNVSLLFTIMAL